MASIVTVNVSLQLAPEPETLQRTGALISQGGTITAPGTSSLLTQLSDLTPLLTLFKTITSITWLSSTATVTTAAPHGFTTSDTLWLTIQGAAPAGYNGNWFCTVTGASQFTFALATNPGPETSPGTYAPLSVTELTQMATTYFSQGSGVGVFVLELGAGGPNDGIASLSSYITANPNTQYIDGAVGFYYAYLLPREWDGNNANLLNLIAQYESPTSKTYFIVTTNLANYQIYTSLMKDVVSMIEAPAYGQWNQNSLTAISYSGSTVTATTTTAHGILVGQWFQIQGVSPVGYNGWAQALLGTAGSTILYALSSNPGAESVLGTLEASLYVSAGVASGEFSLAADFQHILNYNPSSSNKVTPNAFAFLFGVTPFPTQGNSALLTTLQQNNVNYIGTGAEGGISNTIMLWGTTEDGNDFQVWYSIDWIQINADIDISNTVINGSNNPINPLYYNQPGINTLQATVTSLVNTGVAYGLVLGLPVQTELSPTDFDAALSAGTYAGLSVINAVPFAVYTQLNPSDYAIGRYAGLTLVYTPQRGFINIVFDVNASFFPSQV